MSDIRVVPCRAQNSAMLVSGVVSHLCPFRDERDDGRTSIRWVVQTHTIELHSLRVWLDSLAEKKTSHEQFTAAVRAAVSGLEGIAEVQVVSYWETAGFKVTAEALR